MKLQQIYNPITADPYRNDETYIEAAPCQELAAYIKCFWGSKTAYKETKKADTRSSIVIPDTCMDIIFDMNYTDHEIKNHFCGMNDEPFHLNPKISGKTISTFAIRFYPWSAYLFSEDTLINTKNQSLDLEYNFSELKKEIEPLLFRIHNLEQRVAVAEDALLRRLDLGRMNFYLMNAMTEIIKYKGNLAIEDLARSLHISRRQLERIFAVNTGITPKKLSSLIKYQFLWREILSNKAFHVQDAVAHFGYSDQAHLLNEFKRYHSLTIKEARNNALKNVAFIQ